MAYEDPSQGPQKLNNPTDNSYQDLFQKPESSESKVAKILQRADDEEIDHLAAKVEDEFTQCRSARLFQENIWIRCHQNCKGVYSPDINYNGGNSRVFVQVTRPKVSNAHARLMEVALPPGENAWDVSSTRDPFIPELLLQLLQKNLPPEDIRKAIKEAADKAAENMTRKISSQLDETNWAMVLQQTTLHLCEYGISIVGAPFAVPTYQSPEAAKRNEDPELMKRWQKIINLPSMEASGYVDEYRPQLEAYNPFEVYPDPAAHKTEDLMFVTIRKVLNRSQVMDLTKLDGFKADIIKEVLQKTKNGDWTPERWESVINITNQQFQMNCPADRFIVKIRWGFLSGDDIEKAGIKIEESQRYEQVMCQVWVLGGRVIYLQVSDLYRCKLPFYFTPYNMVPHSIWGSGPAEYMWDSQDMINAAARSACDNMAMIAGPMTVVHTNRLAPGEEAMEIAPWKIFRVEESELPGATPNPIIFFNPQSHLDEFLKLMQFHMNLSDEQTSLPKMLQGESGEGVHNRTSSGAQLQFNNALTPMKVVASNLDNCLIAPMIGDMIRFNLKFSKDPSIVGDFKVTAKGLSGLMARDIANQKLANLLTTVVQNPEAAKRVDWNRVSELNMKGSGLVDEHIFFTETEQRARDEQEQQMQAVNQAAAAQLQSGINMQAEQQQAANEKMRAQTTPQDMLLQAMEAVPEECTALKLKLIEKVLAESGNITPDLQKSFEDAIAMQEVKDHDTVHQMGTEAANREIGPTELHAHRHKERLETSKQEHAVKMAGMKPNGG